MFFIKDHQSSRERKQIFEGLCLCPNSTFLITYMDYLKACAFNENDIYVKVNKIEGFFELILIKVYLEEVVGE